MANKIINDFTVLFKTVLDEKSKQEVGKNIRGLLNNAVISFDESEIKRNIVPIVNMIQQVFDKAGIKFDGEKLLGMSGKDALQSMANMKAEEFQNAFNQALAKSGGVKIDFGDVDISGISTSLNQLESELSDIHRKVVDAPKKSVSEIEDSIRKLKSSQKSVQQIERTLNAVNKQSNIQSKDTAINSLTKAHRAIVESQEKNDPWQIQYQNMLKFVSKYEAMAGKIKPLVDTSNPEFKQLYDMLSPKSSSMKISLQHFVDIANGNELTEYKHQPWAREDTLRHIGSILSSGISVKGDGAGDGDGKNHTNLSNAGDDGNNVDALKINELQNHIRSNEENIENLRKQRDSKQKSYMAFKGIDAESAVGSRREIYDDYGADYYSTDALTAAQYATGPGSHVVITEITPKTPLVFNATDFVESGDYSKLYENPEFISAFKDALIQQIKKTTTSGKEQDKKVSEIQNADLYTTDGTKVNLDNAENNQITLNNLAKKAGFDSVIIDKVLDYPSNVLDDIVGNKERKAVKTKLSKTIAVLSDDILNVVGFREAIETDRGTSLSTKVTKKVPDYYQMPTYTTEKGTKKKKAVTELSDDYKERVDINNQIKELKNTNQNLQTELDSIKNSTQKDVSETSSNISDDTKNQTSTAKNDAAVHNANAEAINNEVQAQNKLNQTEDQNSPAKDDSGTHNTNADAIKNEIQAQEKLKNIQQQPDNIDNDAEIIAQENGALENKLELLRNIAKQYGMDISQRDRNRYESLNQKDKNDDLTSKEKDKFTELGHKIDEADQNLMRFEETYNRIVLKLANGKKINILPDDKGLRSLYNFANGSGNEYNGIAVDSLEFVRKGVEIHQKNTAAINAEVQAQSTLNQVETQNPPTQDESSIHNANADAINNETRAREKLNDAESKNPPRVKTNNENIQTILGDEVGAFAQTVRNQIEDIADPNMAKAWSRFADMVDAENNAIQQHKKLNTVENQDLPAQDKSNTHNANAESIKKEEQAQSKLNETEAQNPPAKDDSNVHNANTNSINNETQAQEKLNQSEHQNPPTQDESSIHNTNADAINNKVQAQANLNKTEAQNPLTKDDTNIHNANAEAINNEVQVQAKLNQIEAQNPPVKDVSNVHSANAKSISNEIHTQEQLIEKNKAENILLQKQKEIFNQILVLQSKEDLLTAKKGQKAGYYQQKIDDILKLISLQEVYQKLCGQPIEGNFKYSTQQLDDAVITLAGARMAAEDIERLTTQLNDVKANKLKSVDDTPQIQGENNALDEQNTKLKENITLKEKVATVNKSSQKETSVVKESSSLKVKSTKTEAQDETLKKEKISDTKNKKPAVKDNSAIHNANIKAINAETQAQKKLNQAENHNPKMEPEIKKEAMSYDELKQKVETYIKVRRQMFSLMDNNRPWQHMLPNVEAAQANITNLFPEKGDKPTDLTASMVSNMLSNQTINEDHIKQLAIALGIEVPQAAQKAENAINKVVVAQDKLNNTKANNNVEVQNNENKIQSYEELCEVITRLNTLRAKQLTPKEYSEKDEILTRLKATKGKSAPNKQISDFMQWSSMINGSAPVNVDQMAKFLGMQNPKMNKNIKSDKNAKKKTGTDVQQIELENKAIDKQNVKLKENINLKQQTEHKTAIPTNINQSTVLPAQTVPKGTISTEATELKAVEEQVVKVTNAINTKTQAFLAEQKAVKNVATSEVHALGEVEKKVNSIKIALSNVSQVLNNVKSDVSVESGLSNININVNRNNDKNADQNNVDESVIQRLLRNIYTVKLEATDNTKTNNKTNKTPSVKTNKTNAVNTLKSTDNLQDSANVDNVLAIKNILSLIKIAVERIDSKIIQGTTSYNNNDENKKTYQKKDNAESYAGSQFSPEKIKTQSMYLAKFRAQLMTTGKLTDDVDLQIYELLNGLSKVQNGPDFSKWNQQFLQLKTKVGIGDIFGKAEDKISTASYEQLIELQKTRNKLELQYTKAEDGSPLKQFYAEQIAQMDGVIAKQEELILNEQQRAQFAKLGTEQSFKIQENAAKKETQNNKKALAADKKLKKRQAMVGKANSIVSRAESTWLEAGELDHLQLPDTFQAQVMQHREELDKLILKLHEVNIAQELTNDDVDDIRRQTAEVNKQTEALSRLVAEYQKLSGDNVDESLSRATNLNFDDQNLSITDYEKQMKAYVADVTNGKGKIKEFNAETKTLTYTMKTGRNEYTEYTAAVRNLDHQLVSVRGSTKKAETFLQATARKMRELSSYFTGMTLFYRMTSVIRQGVGYIKEIDAALTELKKVTDETEKTYEKFLDTASRTADKVGSTIKDVVSSTADWARLGYTIQEAHKLAESTQILMNVSEFTDVNQATDSLISSIQAFKYTAEESMGVVDILNTIGKQYCRDRIVIYGQAVA